MVLSWAMGNTDGHARNHSILITNGVARLAPAYDVAPTLLFAASSKMGLWIDGQAELRWITREHVVREMTAWGVPPSDGVDVVAATLARLAETVPAAAQELGALVPESIVDETMQHLAQVRTGSAS
jgi:serine/threonine-protein kinase HipA